MTEPALREQLHAAYADVHLHDPLEDVLRRGRRLRRARRAPLLGGVAAVVAATLVLGLPGGSTPSAFAAWTSSPRVLTPGDIAAIAASCQSGSQPLPPVAISDARGDFAFTLFTDGTRAVSCGRYHHDGFWREGGSSSLEVTQRQQVLDGAAPVTLEQAGDLTIHDDHAASVWGWASSRATRIVVIADGHTTRATVHDGVFAAWWPHAGTNSTGGRLTAYDRAGTPLRTITFATR
jgi:hypothetical protein